MSVVYVCAVYVCIQAKVYGCMSACMYDFACACVCVCVCVCVCRYAMACHAMSCIHVLQCKIMEVMQCTMTIDCNVMHASLFGMHVFINACMNVCLDSCMVAAAAVVAAVSVAVAFAVLVFLSLCSSSPFV